MLAAESLPSVASQHCMFPINFELWMMQVKLVSLFLTQTLFPPPTLPGLLLVSFSHFLSLTLRTV